MFLQAISSGLLMRMVGLGGGPMLMLEGYRDGHVAHGDGHEGSTLQELAQQPEAVVTVTAG